MDRVVSHGPEMSPWEPDRYLAFEKERTLPARDLVRRIELEWPSRIVDLGCGTGTSTAVLRERWPRASIVGIDRSEEMLRRARASVPTGDWVSADRATWTPSEPYDLVFSNAALQWIRAPAAAAARLFGFVAEGGALAFQIPIRYARAPGWAEVLAQVVRREPWIHRFPTDAREDGCIGMGAIYDLLAPRAARVDLWDTEYVHVLPGPQAIVEWTRGTGLRPWLEKLDDPAEREQFLTEYTAGIASRYPKRGDGKVLFPFPRRFVIAYR